jgi:cob(I)alamin adenosyltransferase
VAGAAEARRQPAAAACERDGPRLERDCEWVIWALTGRPGRTGRDVAANLYNRTVKIYTRTGDAGETALFDGTRVAKSDPRIGACGDVDELHAWIGFVRASQPGGNGPEIDGMLEAVQRDLLAVGARLADPGGAIAGRVSKVAITPDDITRLEGWIDTLEATLPPLRRFILAGGSPSGASAHVARTVCRRAEREIVALGAHEYPPEILTYINRLSDLLFVIARALNHRLGMPETEW